MKNILIILITNFFFLSCIDMIKSSDEEFYESVHIQGGGWFEFYENSENENLELFDDFTLQVWFSGQLETENEATCIVSLKGNESNISIYRNPNIDNMLMIYNNENLVQEIELESINFSAQENFYLLSIVKDQNEIMIYINDNLIMQDDDTPLIITNDDTIEPIIGTTLNSNNVPKNLWYGYIDEIRLWNTALHDTTISFHNQYPTKLSPSYEEAYLLDLHGLWDFRIEMSAESIDNVFQDIDDRPLYTIMYTLESMSNELSELGR